MKKLIPLLLLPVSLSGYMQDKLAAVSPKMFDRLSQAGSPGQFDGRYFRPGKYTSLALSPSFDIVVKEHGGTIQVESVEGEGSEFVILLPLITTI